MFLLYTSLLPELCHQLQGERDERHCSRHVHQRPTCGAQELDSQAEAADGGERRLQCFPSRRRQDGGRHPGGGSGLRPRLSGGYGRCWHGVRRLFRWISTGRGRGWSSVILNIVSLGGRLKFGDTRTSIPQFCLPPHSLAHADLSHLTVCTTLLGATAAVTLM